MENIEVEPQEAKRFLHLESQPGGVYEFGDSLDFAVLRVSGLRVKKFTLLWRYSDDADGEQHRFIVPV